MAKDKDDKKQDAKPRGDKGGDKGGEKAAAPKQAQQNLGVKVLTDFVDHLDVRR